MISEHLFNAESGQVRPLWFSSRRPSIRTTLLLAETPHQPPKVRGGSLPQGGSHAFSTRCYSSCNPLGECISSLRHDVASSDSEEVTATVNVVQSTSEDVSISLSTNSVTFPDIFPGGLSQAQFDMTNKLSVAINAAHTFDSDPAGCCGWGYSPFWPGPIPAGETVRWTVSFQPPVDATPGNYNFAITVTAVAGNNEANGIGTRP